MCPLSAVLPAQNKTSSLIGIVHSTPVADKGLLTSGMFDLPKVWRGSLNII